ncbi:MAG: SLC5 family protein, partial [Pseudomonadota bacterium]|nr:SLC5 family protein [Pseudomonadota bacterium]
FAAAGIRLLIVPAIIVIPGIVSFKLFGDIGDSAYGRIVATVLPDWLSGVFAAAMAAAVLTTFNSNLNSAAALYVCDIHESYVNKTPNVPKLSGYVTVLLCLVSLALIPVYQQADSIINLVQKLYGLLSMPILSVFIVGLLFRNVHAFAAIGAVVFGVSIYALMSFEASPLYAPFGLHYIHLMFATLIGCVAFALIVNRMVFRQKAEFSLAIYKND